MRSLLYGQKAPRVLVSKPTEHEAAGSTRTEQCSMARNHFPGTEHAASRRPAAFQLKELSGSQRQADVAPSLEPLARGRPLSASIPMRAVVFI